MLVVVVCIGSAAVGRTCLTQLTKTNDAILVVANDNQFESQDVFLISNYPDFGIDSVALLPDLLFAPSGTIEFLKEKKPVYKSPGVNRRWVWWNSIISNS